MEDEGYRSICLFIFDSTGIFFIHANISCFHFPFVDTVGGCLAGGSDDPPPVGLLTQGAALLQVSFPHQPPWRTVEESPSASSSRVRCQSGRPSSSGGCGQWWLDLTSRTGEVWPECLLWPHASKKRPREMAMAHKDHRHYRFTPICNAWLNK